MGDIKKRVNGSNSAFMWGRIVFTDSKAGCLRNILLSAHRVTETDIPEKYRVMGALNEDLHEKQLKDLGLKYEKEFVVKHKIDPDSDVEFSGRVDFLIDKEVYKEVEELKSTDSKTKRNEVIGKGNWIYENLAQAVSYMVSLQLITGRLIYTYYERNEGDQLVPKDERAFEIVIEESGRISMDGKPTNFTVNDLINHRLAAKQVIETGEVWDRPYNWDRSWKSPCKYCPWSAACDKYDAGEITTSEAFISEAKKLIKPKETK